MKIDKQYTGQIIKAGYIKKSIKGVEDEKVFKRVGLVQVEIVFQCGDLDAFVDPNVADDSTYTSCVWNDEIIGNYELNINDVVSEVKIVRIAR